MKTRMCNSAAVSVCFGRRAVAASLIIALSAASAIAIAAEQPDKGSGSRGTGPNIVYILADDLGYGDVRCYGGDRSKIPTPHLDRMAEQGMRFTDAHSCSSVCTPTRYGILTGRYSWRSRLQKGVLYGDDSPLIVPDRLTVASLLKRNGYTTICLGKWHLGLGLPPRAAAGRAGNNAGDGAAAVAPTVADTVSVAAAAGRNDPWRFDYAGRIERGPIELGFNEFFGIAASLDMWPFAFINNDRFEPVPTVEKKWIRTGPAAADFEAIDVMPKLAQRSVETIRRLAPAAREGKPFFIYLALTAPHTPIVPVPAWQGKSGLSEYADFVMQVDDLVGQVLAALDEAKIARDTLVFFTSDNGCSPQAKIDELIAAGHYPNGPLRGHKADIWEGGHRVPLIARWPAKVRPGTRCDDPVCLNDLMATCADLLNVKLPDDAGEDSESMLPMLLQTGGPRADRALVHHSVDGRFAIRHGKWKLALCPGSGGWSQPRDPRAAQQGLPPMQLYDLEADLGEQTNLVKKHPEIARQLRERLERIVAEGRSTPGKAQRNDVAVQIERPAGQ